MLKMVLFSILEQKFRSTETGACIHERNVKRLSFLARGTVRCLEEHIWKGG